MTEKEKIREYLAEYADDVTCDYATSRDIKGVILPFIDSMQDEPKECMYSKDNYTDEDRKALCDGCEEDCKLNQKVEKERKRENMNIKKKYEKANAVLVKIQEMIENNNLDAVDFCENVNRLLCEYNNQK